MLRKEREQGEETKEGEASLETIIENSSQITNNTAGVTSQEATLYHFPLISSPELPPPPSGRAHLVDGNLVCGGCVVLGERGALVGLCGLGGGGAHW